MRVSVFFAATILFASGCAEESGCIQFRPQSFNVETCSTIPKELSLNVDGTCADATFY
jgi:hypothetical protein